MGFGSCSSGFQGFKACIKEFKGFERKFEIDVISERDLLQHEGVAPRRN